MLKQIKFINFFKSSLKIVLLAAMISLPFFGVTSAQEQEIDISGYDFYLKNFTTEVKINKNSTIDVKETITANFLQERHGIFREIPTSYPASFGLVKKIFLDNITVTNESGDPIQFTKSNFNGVLTLKIGDPEVTITGEKTYVIAYSAKNVFLFSDNSEELFWNITGNAWPVPILSATGSFELLPESKNLRSEAFFGPLFSTNKAQANLSQNNLSVTFSNLEPGEGLSLAAAWQKGALNEPSSFEYFKFFLLANWWLAIPSIILIFAVWYLFAHAIDPKGLGTIVPEFSIPKETNLLEGAALYDEHIQTKDLTAMIVSWAVDGFIQIKETKKKALFGSKSEFSLIKKKNLTGRSNYEIDFYNFLFEDKKELELKKIEPVKFNVELGKLKNKVFSNLKKQGYFINHPENTRNTFYIVGAIITIGSLAGIAFYNSIGIFAIIATFIAGIIIILLGPIAPKRTLEGVKQKQKLQGFELYLKTAERYRLKWQEEERIFERFLPYAISFGIAGIWAGYFKDKLTKPPSWYSGYALAHFNTVSFTNSLNSNFGSAITSTVTQAQSHSGSSAFGGGGFSGGGVGGGGGGSW